jgi:hypothetical protein
MPLVRYSKRMRLHSGGAAYGSTMATWLGGVVTDVAEFFRGLSLCFSSWLAGGVSSLSPFDCFSNRDAACDIVMSGSLSSWGRCVSSGVAWTALRGWLLNLFSVRDSVEVRSLLDICGWGESVENSFSEWWETRAGVTGECACTGWSCLFSLS